MELAAGGSLAHQLLRMGGRMSEQQFVVGVLRPLVAVLAELHSRGIAHRDIKPANILFSGTGGWVGDYLASAACLLRELSWLGVLEQEPRCVLVSLLHADTLLPWRITCLSPTCLCTSAHILPRLWFLPLIRCAKAG